MNTKNLCTVPTSELTDLTNVIVEDSGELKRVNSGLLSGKIKLFPDSFINYKSGQPAEFVSESIPMMCSDYVEVPYKNNYLYLKDHTTYTSHGSAGIAFYDKKKRYLTGMQYTNYDKIILQLPHETKYVRFTIGAKCQDTYQFVTAALRPEHVWEDFDVLNGCYVSGQSMNPDHRFSGYQNPLENLMMSGGMASILHTWGFIGDSLSSGEHEYVNPDGTTGYVDLYDYSFGQCVARELGVTARNFSKGGATCRKILEDFGTQIYGTPENLCQAYVVYLGMNDKDKLPYAVGAVSTDIHVDDYTKNAETFCGYYGTILQRLMEVQPKAKIFLMTMPCDGAPDNEYNEAIRAMAELFSSNCYLIDLFTYGQKQDSAWRERYTLGWHLNAMGYQLYSWYIITYVDWIIRNHPEGFKEAAFIGTEYTHGS